jgi:hypothetical protein
MLCVFGAVFGAVYIPGAVFGADLLSIFVHIAQK